MTVNDALKMLYEKMGGTADVSGVTTSSEMIDYIEDVAGGGGGSSLPSVTSDDNGKVLTVVEGEWDKAEASGGGDFNITMTYDNDAERYQLNKTWKEIKDAFVAGNRCIVTYEYTETGEGYSNTRTDVSIVVGYISEIATGVNPSTRYYIYLTFNRGVTAVAAGENEYPEFS